MNSFRNSISKHLTVTFLWGVLFVNISLHNINLQEKSTIHAYLIMFSKTKHSWKSTTPEATDRCYSDTVACSLFFCGWAPRWILSSQRRSFKLHGPHPHEHMDLFDFRNPSILWEVDFLPFENIRLLLGWLYILPPSQRSQPLHTRWCVAISLAVSYELRTPITWSKYYDWKPRCRFGS